jgi:hypothetical protein
MMDVPSSVARFFREVDDFEEKVNSYRLFL